MRAESLAALVPNAFSEAGGVYTGGASLGPAGGDSRPRDETIAEFVEADGILAALAKLGVDYAQETAIGEPRPVD